MANANSTLQQMEDVCLSISMDNFDEVNLLLSRAVSLVDLIHIASQSDPDHALLNGTLETATDTALKFLSGARSLLNQGVVHHDK